MAKLAPIVNNAQFINGIPANGAKLFFYAAGSSTKQTTYADEAGTIPQSNPIILDSRGESAQPVWFTEGLSYNIVFAPSTDSDPPVSPIWDIDDVTGINDSSVTLEQWVASSMTPTYVSATQFTLVGDQTTAFHVNRRIKATVTAGTVYGYISASVFGALTTVTVVLDSGVLDSGLSVVQLGLITANNTSLPKIPNFVTTAMIQNDAVTSDKIIADAILARHISDSALGMNMINGVLLPTVSGNALTMSIKTKAGTDPSATDPVLILFRNVGETLGDYTTISLTAATSFTISSGSTLGSSNNTAFKIWWVGFNDSGTLRLGVVNTVNGSSISPLPQFSIASSIAEGGAGGADSSQVFYTGSAVTSKAYTILGYSTYETGLATAGSYNAIPSRTQLFGIGVTLPAQLVKSVTTSLGTVATGTTTIPADNTIPQITEGDLYLTRPITPSSTTSILEIDVNIGTVSSSITTGMVTAVFQDAIANALACTHTSIGTNSPSSVALKHFMLASSTSSLTFTVRIGGNVAGTTTLNGVSGGQLYGGVLATRITIKEFSA